MVTTGRQGYLDAARGILETATTIREGVATRIDGLQVIGDPKFLIAFMADREDIDIYLVNDALKQAGWRMNALQLPAALHFCVTRPNTGARGGRGIPGGPRNRPSTTRGRTPGTPAASGAMYGFGHTPQGNADDQQA